MIELPSDAREEMHDTKGKYVIEEWSGLANFAERAIKLTQIAPEMVETTIPWEKIVGILPRDGEGGLAGEYQLILDEDFSVVKAVMCLSDCIAAA
eukprot:SAG31_NODE_2591_length_5425_cov_4.004694_4_plen_95_part_00